MHPSAGLSAFSFRNVNRVVLRVGLPSWTAPKQQGQVLDGEYQARTFTQGETGCSSLPPQDTASFTAQSLTAIARPCLAANTEHLVRTTCRARVVHDQFFSLLAWRSNKASMSPNEMASLNLLLMFPCCLQLLWCAHTAPRKGLALHMS
jgi:hypothetical protein